MRHVYATISRKIHHVRFLRAVFDMSCSFSFVAANISIVGNIPEGHLIIHDVMYHVKPFKPPNFVPSPFPSRGCMAFPREALNSGFTRPYLHLGFLETLCRLRQATISIVLKESIQKAKILFETRKKYILYQNQT